MTSSPSDHNSNEILRFKNQLFPFDIYRFILVLKVIIPSAAKTLRTTLFIHFLTSSSVTCVVQSLMCYYLTIQANLISFHFWLISTSKFNFFFEKKNVCRTLKSFSRKNHWKLFYFSFKVSQSKHCDWRFRSSLSKFRMKIKFWI